MILAIMMSYSLLSFQRGYALQLGLRVDQEVGRRSDLLARLDPARYLNEFIDLKTGRNLAWFEIALALVHIDDLSGPRIDNRFGWHGEPTAEVDFDLDACEH